MSPGVWIVVAGAALLVGLAGLGQVLAYRREGSVLTVTQLALRLIMGLLLFAVVALALWGLPRLVPPPGELTHAQRLSAVRHLAAFWTVIIGLAVAMVVLALADLRHLRAAQRRARAAMYRNLAQVQEELRASRAAADNAGKPGSEE
jgi:hypothetical protein